MTIIWKMMPIWLWSQLFLRWARPFWDRWRDYMPIGIVISRLVCTWSYIVILKTTIVIIYRGNSGSSLFIHLPAFFLPIHLLLHGLAFFFVLKLSRRYSYLRYWYGVATEEEAIFACAVHTWAIVPALLIPVSEKNSNNPNAVFSENKTEDRYFFWFKERLASW